MPESTARDARVAVIWLDWYPYHVARFRGMHSHPALAGNVVGIELIGGIGVHAGLKFREDLPASLPIETLMPGTGWHEAGKFALARKLWRRLSELDPEVVLVPGYYTLPALAAALWARVHGTASVLMTESTAGDHLRSPWKERFKSLAIRCLFNWAVAGGKAHVDYLRQLGFRRDRIAGFYDVVDNDLFRDGTRTLRLQSTGLQPQKYFLYVGRLAAEKNVDALLQSWLRYREEGGAWPLVLVGDGPEAAALKEAASASPYGAHVLFPGLKSSGELLPFYAFAGCFVLPSTREPWGLVVNEAMAAGLPVLVSTRCGCAPNLVMEGFNGFTFDPANVATLTYLLHRVQSLAPEQHKRMSEASRTIIGDYSPAGFGRSVASIVAAATAGGASLAPAPGGAR